MTSKVFYFETWWRYCILQDRTIVTRILYIKYTQVKWAQHNIHTCIFWLVNYEDRYTSKLLNIITQIELTWIIIDLCPFLSILYKILLHYYHWMSFDARLQIASNCNKTFVRRTCMHGCRKIKKRIKYPQILCIYCIMVWEIWKFIPQGKLSFPWLSSGGNLVLLGDKFSHFPNILAIYWLMYSRFYHLFV